MTNPQTITVPAEVMRAYVNLRRSVETWRDYKANGDGWGRVTEEQCGEYAKAMQAALAELERVSPVCGG